MSEFYIGLMSGTSADGVDAVLAESLTDSKTIWAQESNKRGQETCKFQILAHDSLDFPPDLRKKVISLFTPGDNEIDRMGLVGAQLGTTYANSVRTLLNKASISPQKITAIGCHGQTIRHRPAGQHAFSLQIGDASQLASQVGIPVVHQFRQADIAKGGQGAPLAPAFHQDVFASNYVARAIINIGGISNITWLHPQQPVLGWDIGPGNGLMDAWISLNLNQPYDRGGRWAKSGQVDHDLLNALLAHPYFLQPAPKSTGKEVFTLFWLKQTIEALFQNKTRSAHDIQRTLLEFSAQIIANDLAALDSTKPVEIYVCGGGAHNSFLMQRLSDLCGNKVVATSQLGIAPNWVEASAFAWLAKRFWHREPGNLPSVTGAKDFGVLGQLVYP